MSENVTHRRDVLWVTLVAALVFAPGMIWGIPFGKAVVGGLRVLDGDIPYRDFWSMYAPGQFYAVAGVFGLFGRELLVQAAAAVALAAVGVGFFFSLCRRVGLSRGLSCVMAGIAILPLWKTSPELNNWVLVLPLYLAAIDRIAVYFREGGSRPLWIAGILFGLAAANKHDVAAYVALGSVLATLGVWWLAGSRRPASWLAPWRVVCRIGLGCACVVLPVTLALWITAGTDAWRDLIAFPATDFRSIRSEAYPGILPDLSVVRAWLGDPFRPELIRNVAGSLAQWVYLNVPQLVFLITAGVVIRSRRTLDPVRLAHMMLCLCCLPFFWAAAHVQPNTHIISMALFSLLLVGMGWTHSRLALGPWTRRAMALGLMVYAGALVIPTSMNLYLVLSAWPESRVLQLPGVQGVRVSAEEYERYTAVADFLKRNTAPDERIYVGAGRHDAVVIGNQRFYIFAERRNATRYDEPHPAVVDRPDVQQEMIEDLERAGVRCVVLWRFGWSDRRLDRIKQKRMEAIPSLGADLLDRYIEENFRLVERYGEYEIRWRDEVRSANGPTATGIAAPLR